VCLHAVAAVGLKSALGHRYPLLFPKENLRFSNNSEYTVGQAGNPAGESASPYGIARDRHGVF
jgi:hypothetical protein